MRYKSKDLVIAAILLAIGIAIPMAFHLSGINGDLFSPMHIPVLLTGLMLNPSLGLIVGMLTPILNLIIIGVPEIPFLWIMIVELGLHGLMGGVFYKKIGLKLIPSLIFSILLSKVGGILSIIILNSTLGLNLPDPFVFLKDTTIFAMPGIIIQFLIIPTLVKFYNVKNRSILNQ